MHNITGEMISEHDYFRLPIQRHNKSESIGRHGSSFSKRIIYIFLFFLIFLCTSVPVQASDDAFCGPWGEESFMEASPHHTRPNQQPSDESILNLAFINGVEFFRDVISPIDGDRCPMYPSCSQYGVLVLRKHGPFMGFIMIADRLIHERDEMRYAPEIKVGDRWRYYDPLENNDFWWVEREEN